MTALLSISIPNRPGALVELLEALSKSGINLDGVEAEALGDYGMVRLSVSDADAALRIVQEQGHQGSAVDALEVELSNRPGELSGVLRTLADADVNVVSLFGTVGGDAHGGRLLLRVNDRRKALKALGLE